jgi:hypothetical protein
MNPPLIIITPVKDSLNTTRETIKHIFNSDGDFPYYIFNDLSSEETEGFLQSHQKEFKYTLINLQDHVDTPSPNYRTVLKMARKMALDAGAHLLIVESDVMVKSDTIPELMKLAEELDNPGMIGSVTVNEKGEINFPYLHIKGSDPDIYVTDRSLSFCCTLLTNPFLAKVDFEDLDNEKDWYDVHISKRSRKLGFNNFIVKKLPVVHKPHSSRPWKQEKYSNPIKYYLKKIFLGRDRI